MKRTDKSCISTTFTFAVWILAEYGSQTSIIANQNHWSRYSWWLNYVLLVSIITILIPKCVHIVRISIAKSRNLPYCFVFRWILTDIAHFSPWVFDQTDKCACSSFWPTPYFEDFPRFKYLGINPVKYSNIIPNYKFHRPWWSYWYDW